MNWDEYVDLARDLVWRDSEASRRSAVSRAYYGAFNRARRWLGVKGLTIENHRAHDGVWRAFRDAEPATLETSGKWQEVGELGGGLRGLRNQADYADSVPRLDRQAVAAVNTATRIIDLLDELEFVDDRSRP
jgi:uncharacterized protein (UPF0332 family)